MKIVMTNTATKERTVVKFGELISRLQAENLNVINRRWINFKLLNGETFSVNGCKYQREIESNEGGRRMKQKHFNGRFYW